MRPSKIILPLLLSFTLSFSAHATIAIEAVVSNDVASECEGSFTVVADGTAGPFTVRLISSVSGVPDAVYNNVKVELTIEDLCNGVYEVHVFPTRFPSCVTKLEAELKSPKDPKALTGAEGLKLEVSPNPTRGEVTVFVTGPQVEGQRKPGNWTITLLDAGGLPLKDISVESSVKSNRLSVPLDLSDYPRGVYYVRVRTPDGVEETGRVVVQ